MAEEVKKIEHKNIFEALSAFQSENPEIIKNGTVTFGEGTKQVSFKYAELEDFLKVVRPLLSKQGLSVTHQGNSKGELLCAIYHTTYKLVNGKKTTKMLANNGESFVSEIIEEGFEESGVIRSLPIKVKREGVMKEIGADSTYARRYTLAEVLGIASDEDKDAEINEKAQINVETFAYTQVEKQLKGLKKADEVEKKLTFLKEELAIVIEGKKAPSIGLNADQYKKLIVVAEDVLANLSGDITVEKEDDGSVPPDQIPDLEESSK